MVVVFDSWLTRYDRFRKSSAFPATLVITQVNVVLTRLKGS